jgi:hypothetical protein
MVKAGMYFTTKTLRSLAEDHKDYTEQYEKAQRSLVKEVVDIACKFVSQSLFQLDFSTYLQQRIRRCSSRWTTLWRI